MKRFFVPVATMLGIQVMVSVSVIALSIMMPVVARDLAIEPKLVGVFVAGTYFVASIVALAAAGPVVRLGAIRVSQAALVMGAIGLALNSVGLVAATALAVLCIGCAQGPTNPASAHLLSQRVPREYFGAVFSIKQTGVPIGFALAGIVFPQLLVWVGWRGASLIAAGMALLTAAAVELLRPKLDTRAAEGKSGPGIWHSIRFVMAHPQLRVLGCSAFVYVVAQHTFTFYLVTYLYEHCHLTIVQAGGLLSASQFVGTLVRLLSGGMGDRVARMKLLGWTGIGMTVGCLATGFLSSDAPFWLIAVVVMGYGSVVISWNGTSQAEFAHLSPPGHAAAVAAVQTALAFMGSVFGPPVFALLSSTIDYRAAFMFVAACVFSAAVWQLVAARKVLPGNADGV